MRAAPEATTPFRVHDLGVGAADGRMYAAYDGLYEVAEANPALFEYIDRSPRGRRIQEQLSGISPIPFEKAYYALGQLLRPPALAHQVPVPWSGVKQRTYMCQAAAEATGRGTFGVLQRFDQ
ncbi:hypothetical protein [Streptomyces sp. NRRL S-146]|uniref:hypothetical protein n=1 Tax=Streptomyces sp. NRRL S-146 TaxID=1463884 RepID=UPI0004C76CFB|nr:hypothetical protein [Streptomyces sp. NRRL S-146]